MKTLLFEAEELRKRWVKLKFDMNGKEMGPISS